jgi:flagellar hook-associated protein 3
MRTTFASVNRNVQRNLSGRYGDMVKLQEQLATGKRLRKPSDDPIDVSNDIKLRSKQVQLKQYKRNIEDGLAQMGIASSVMSSMNDILHRMKELAIQAANDTNTSSDRQFIQKEVDQLFRQMMSLVNTQFKGDYIFNGTQTKIPPFTQDSSGIELKDYMEGTASMSYFSLTSQNSDTIVTVPNATFTVNGAVAVGQEFQLTATDSSGNSTAIRNVLSRLGNFSGYVEGTDYTVDYNTGRIRIESATMANDLTLAPNGPRGVGMLTYTTNPSPDIQNSATVSSHRVTAFNSYFEIPTPPGLVDRNDPDNNTFQLQWNNPSPFNVNNIIHNLPAIEIGSAEFEEGEDYSIDYRNGMITILSERMEDAINLSGTTTINTGNLTFTNPYTVSPFDGDTWLDLKANDLKIGDKVQLAWNQFKPDDPNYPDHIKNIILDTTNKLTPFPPYNTIVITDDRGIERTFRKVNPDDPNNPKNPDYDIDYKTGEITILSELMRDTLNNLYEHRPNNRVAIDNIQNFNFSNKETAQLTNVKSGTMQTDIKNIFPGSFKLVVGDKEYKEGFGEWTPKYYYDENGVRHEGKNYYDYSVNYETGEITFYNTELFRDVTPNWLGDQTKGTGTTSNYSQNQFKISFDYIGQSKDVYGRTITSHGNIYRAIEEGINIDINTRAHEMLRDPYSGNDMMTVLLRYSQALHTGNRDDIQASIDELGTMYDAVLSSQSELGAKINRLELTLRRNDEQFVEVSNQQSQLEDADLAEVITRLMLAENVYTAALQAAMRVLQPSLANFM